MFSDVCRSFFRQPVADSAPNSERAKAPSASGHTLVADGKKRLSWRTFVARGALVVLPPRTKRSLQRLLERREHMDRVSLNRYNLATNPGKISRIVINGTEIAINMT